MQAFLNYLNIKTFDKIYNKRFDKYLIQIKFILTIIYAIIFINYKKKPSRGIYFNRFSIFLKNGK